MEARAAERAYRKLRKQRKDAWVWGLERARCVTPREFWRMLRAGIKPPAPSLTEFLTHFEALFGGEGAEAVPPEVAESILSALHSPITAAEVEAAASLMASGKSSGLGSYPIELLRGHGSG